MILNKNTQWGCNVIVNIKSGEFDSGYYYATSNPKEVITLHCRELMYLNNQYQVSHLLMLEQENIGNQLILYPGYMEIKPQHPDLTIILNKLWDVLYKNLSLSD